MSVRVVPLTQAVGVGLDDFRPPAQGAEFSARPKDTMADAPVARDGHVILSGDELAGFFAIDRDYAAAHTFAPAGDIGLRMMVMDARFAGKGVARTAFEGLSGYLSAQYPTAEAVWLTVNLRNPRARSLYLRSGFADTGALYHGGPMGPQHILRMPLGQ